MVSPFDVLALAGVSGDMLLLVCDDLAVLCRECVLTRFAQIIPHLAFVRQQSSWSSKHTITLRTSIRVRAQVFF